jgi:TRAP-type C4-dicarboxylate transport system permease small subunit
LDKAKIISSILDTIEAKIAVLCMVFMFLNIFVQILFRLLVSPLYFTEEVSRFSYIWIAFLGLPYTIRKQSNISFELLMQKLSGAPYSILFVLHRLVEVGVMAFLFYWSIRFCIFKRVVLAPALEISMLWVYLILPISFGLGVIRGMQVIVLFFVNRQEMQSAQEYI